jgi:hypothetical protein
MLKPGSSTIPIVLVAVWHDAVAVVATVFAMGPWRRDRPSSLAGIATMELLGESGEGRATRDIAPAVL